MTKKASEQPAFVFEVVEVVKKLWTRIKRKRVFVVSLMGICILGLGLSLKDINRQPVGFDEGIILQAPINMAEKNIYASFGAEYNGQDKVFDPFLSTGPSTTLPISLLFKIFGPGIIQARLVMIGFYIAAIILAGSYAYSRTRSRYAVLAAASVLLILSSGMNFRLDVLGEIPAVVFCLASFIHWRKNRYFLSGIFAALAVLAKFLMLIAIFAGIFLLLLRWLRHRSQRRLILKRGKNYILGAAAPLLLWEIVRFAQTGSPRGYLISLKEFVKFFIKNGSGIAENGTVLTVSTKLDMLLSNIAITRGWLLIFLGLFVSIILFHREKFITVIADHSYPLTFIGTYLVWWLVISNGAYTRYTVPLALISLVVFITIALETTIRGNDFFKKNIPLLVALVILIFGLFKLYIPFKQTDYPLTLKDQKQIAMNIKRQAVLPLAHIGWWQNPEILFLTKLHSKDFRHYEIGTKYNQLISPAMRDIVPETYYKAKAKCEKVIYEKSDYILCEVTRDLEVF